MKVQGSTLELHLKLVYLSAGEESGIPSVAVKCVDIRRNISGEGGLLDCTCYNCRGSNRSACYVDISKDSE